MVKTVLKTVVTAHMTSRNKIVLLTQARVAIKVAPEVTSFQHVRYTALPTRQETTAKVDADNVLMAAFVMHKVVSVQLAVLLVMVEWHATTRVKAHVIATVARIVMAHLESA